MHQRNTGDGGQAMGKERRVEACADGRLNQAHNR